MPLSIKNAVIFLRGPRAVSVTPVAANKITKSAMSAWLMKCLAPLMTKSPPSALAAQDMERTSEPAPGSVIARQSTFSPRMQGRRYFSRWSPAHACRMLLGRATVYCSAMLARPSSRSSRHMESVSSPPPPSSSGMFAAYRPTSRDLAMMARRNSSSNLPLFSTCASWGYSSSSTKRRAVSISRRWDSVREKFIGGGLWWLGDFTAPRPCLAEAAGVFHVAVHVDDLAGDF